MEYNPVFGAVCFYEYDGDLLDFIREAAALGLKWIEFKYDSRMIAGGDAGRPETVKRALEDAGIGISIHMPFDGLNIAAIDESLRTKAVDEMKKSIDYGMSVGAAQATIHGGQMSPVEYSHDRWSAACGANLRSLSELVRYGKSGGFSLCLENGNAYEKFWMKHGINHGELKEARAFVGEELHFTVDFGHALYFSSDPSFLVDELGRDNILMAHLHDNGGSHDSHSPLESGILKLDRLLDRMVRDRWNFPICLEMKKTEDLRFSVALLNDRYRKTLDKTISSGAWER